LTRIGKVLGILVGLLGNLYLTDLLWVELSRSTSIIFSMIFMLLGGHFAFVFFQLVRQSLGYSYVRVNCLILRVRKVFRISFMSEVEINRYFVRVKIDGRGKVVHGAYFSPPSSVYIFNDWLDNRVRTLAISDLAPKLLIISLHLCCSAIVHQKLQMLY
jgi:hypothetical protein